MGVGRSGLIRLFGLACEPSRRALVAGLQRPAEAQARVRGELAASLEGTAYGRSMGLGPRSATGVGIGPGSGWADGSGGKWADLPVVDWTDLAPWVERAIAGEPSVLWPGPVACVEPTSGSGGARKSIPYTRRLLEVFAGMFRVWAADVISEGPRLSRGRIWLSVSPRLGEAQADPGAALATDADYLSGWMRWIVAPFLVGPGLERVTDSGEYRRRLAAALVAAEDLELVSVWSPSHLLMALDAVMEERTWLRRCLGTRLSARRWGALCGRAPDWRTVWPELRFVSCWDEGPAAPLAAEVRRRLPGVRVQGKGLLATEAPVTVPLESAGGPVPLVDRVVLEIETPDGTVVPLEDLEEGTEGSLVVSVPGGFLRYRIGDRVRAGARFRATCRLEFLGRAGDVSDLVGEKLDPGLVAAALGSLGSGLGAVRCLVPEPATGSDPARYLLVTDRWDGSSASPAAELDGVLEGIHHYRLARRLGQLGPAEVLVGSRAGEVLSDVRARAGVRLGDQKPLVLWSRAPGWAAGAIREGMSPAPR